jgi:hypothetical protein
MDCNDNFFKHVQEFLSKNHVSTDGVFWWSSCRRLEISTPSSCKYFLRCCSHNACAPEICRRRRRYKNVCSSTSCHWGTHCADAECVTHSCLSPTSPSSANLGHMHYVTTSTRTITQ